MSLEKSEESGTSSTANYGSKQPLEGSERPSIPKALTRECQLFGVDSVNGANATVSIALNPVALINTECVTVTSAMRKDVRLARSSVAAILGGGSSYRPGPRSIYLNEKERIEGIHTNGTGRDDLHVGNDGNNLVSYWGRKGKEGKTLQDNPLLSAFARLRTDIRGCTDIRKFDVPSLLHPFLQVIRSSSTSADITSLALVAITKFFAYNLISKHSPRLSLAMQLLSVAITQCRFEASDSAKDELVLLRILKLMEGMLSGPGGQLLTDGSVCEMMETVLSMCCQVRLSEMLRRSAEITMISMCQVIFERLKSIEEQDTNDCVISESLDDKSEEPQLKMDAPLKGKNVASPQTTTPASAHFNAPDKLRQSSLETRLPTGTDRLAETQPAVSDSVVDINYTTASKSEDKADIKPYALPSIRELFRVLVNLLEPHDRQHTDPMRIMALRVIDVALEVAGPSVVRHSSLRSLVRDDLCRHLFQLVRSDNMSLLNESLRIIGTLLATCREVLNLQQELFLSYLVACLHPKVEIPREPGIELALYEGIRQPPPEISSGRSTPVPVKDRQKLGMEGGSRKPDAREAMIESIGALVRIPSFLAELFVNYDCEVDRANLCEEMIDLFSRNAFPDSATWSTTNVPPLCLDALLVHIQLVADRLNDRQVTEGFPNSLKLREQRARKKIIIKGASIFNESPKSGINYLALQGIIKDPEDLRSVAYFLKSTSRISKKILGEYVSKKSHESLLSAFLDLFDFSNKRVDEALREMLASFRLPGESALIERIIAVFSEKCCANSTPEGIADKDAVYVLTYAIIMLNTDQHNPTVKAQARMAFNDFARNLRGVNGGKDFAPQYLQEIYNSIKTNEIILPDEHDNKHAFDYAWKELLFKTQISGNLKICNTNVFDSDMFEATWKPIIATLSYVFMSASEDSVYQRVVVGFDQCAQIAAHYGIIDALDHIVYCLSIISTLASDTPPNTALNTEVQAGNKTVMVSELAVKFGRDYRAQLATVVLFRGIIAGNESKIRNGWKHIIRIWVNLFLNSLVPPSFPQTLSVLDMSPIPIQSPSQIINRSERSNDSGIFQTFTSYLSSYAADDPPEPSDEELSDTLCTVDCIYACPFENILDSFLTLPTETLVVLVHAILDKLLKTSSPLVIVVKPDPSSPNHSKFNGHRSITGDSNYDPSVNFALELATILAMRDEQTVATVGKDVAEALQNVIRDASNIHPITVSRAVLYLLHLLNASHEQSILRAPVILHTISSLDTSLMKKSAVPILKGLSLCMRQPGPLRNEIANSPDFWSTIRDLHLIPEVASSVFGLLESILKGVPSAITADNYGAAVTLLRSFANMGNTNAANNHKQDRSRRAVKSSKQHNPRDDETVVRGVKAVTIIYQLSSRVPLLIQQSHLERNEAWNAYWSPIFRALSSQCTNSCRDIRHHAFSGLQRALLSPELASADHQEWTAIFSEVLFPLISQLLKPEVYHSDPASMSDTRVQAATLICKIFLHYLVLLSEWDGMLDLWLRILDVMDRLMNSGQGDNLEEAVPESLKNIILVMTNGGYLVPPSQGSEQTLLWDETWKRLERFLPNMYAEIFPEHNSSSQATNGTTNREQELPTSTTGTLQPNPDTS